MDEPREVWVVETRQTNDIYWYPRMCFPKKDTADAYIRNCKGEDYAVGSLVFYRPVRYLPAESVREVLEAAKKAIEDETIVEHDRNCSHWTQGDCTCGATLLDLKFRDERDSTALRLIEAKLKEQGA